MKVNWLPAVVHGRVAMTTHQLFNFFYFEDFKVQKNKREYPITFRNLIKQAR